MASMVGSATYSPSSTLNLGASLQADALGGMGDASGGDLSSLVNQLLKRKQMQEQQAHNDASRAAIQARRDAEKAKSDANTEAVYGPTNAVIARGRALHAAGAMVPEQTAAQRAMSMTGGMTGQAYSDMTRQMLANTLAGVPQTEYTGMTELAKAGAGASQAATEQAGKNNRLKQSNGNAALLKAVEQS